MELNTILTTKTRFSMAIFLLPIMILVGATIITGTMLVSSNASADNDNVVDQINITVPTSCTMSGTGMNSHNTEINNGLYVPDIGSTTLHAFCNDNEGFAIYAAGYTGNEVGGTNSNKLVGTNASGNAVIETGTATTAGNPDVSNWAMKLAISQDSGDTTGTNTLALDNGFGNYHIVPNEYTKVAHKNSGTDMTDITGGVKLTTTYATYISKTQPADTYTGQVIYTLVHPANHPIPDATMLDIGRTVSAKMKTLAAGTTKAFNVTTSDIKAIRMAESLPNDFVPSEANTVSAPNSRNPIYIFYDNTNNAGVMYFYAGEYQVVMNPDSSHMFRSNLALSDISGLATWDASNVTSMLAMFVDSVVELTNLDALASWDTSSVQNMQALFQLNPPTSEEGYSSSLTDISALANWDVSSVTNMGNLFYNDVYISSIAPLANWDVSNVTRMDHIFNNDVGSAGLTDISPLANWDTGKVTNLQSAFRNNVNLSDLSALANWDTSSVTDMSFLFQHDEGLIEVSALANWDTSSLTNMLALFSGTTNLTDASGIANWNTSNVTDMSYVFIHNESLVKVDLSNWDTSKVTTMRAMFNVGESYQGNGQLREIIGLEDLNTSNVTDMTTMFYGAGQMTNYDIANWDVSKVESFNHMFCDNYKLQSLDLSRWNVSSVKTMNNMFDDAYALTTIGDVSQWDTRSLVDVASWLNGAASFVGNNGTLDLSGWNTTNLKTAGEMFRAVKLKTIDLSGWTFSSITNDAWDGAGSGIYYEYGNLLAEYKGFGVMFEDASQLTAVYVSQSGLNSFNAVVANGVNTTDMWTRAGVTGFTVK